MMYFKKESIENLTENEVLEIINNVINGLEIENLPEVEEDYDMCTHYLSLYPKIEDEGYYEEDWDHFSEKNLSQYVKKYPKLNSKLKEIVEKIINIIVNRKVYAFWATEEEQAGTSIARELALYDDEYSELFANLLKVQDLDHEVYQNDYIIEIIKKWGINDHTILLVEARKINRGQHGTDLVSELREEYGLKKFEIKSLLSDLRNKIINAEEDEYSDSEWYSGFMYDSELLDLEEESEDDFEAIEDFLAVEAVKDEELYPAIRDIVRKIIQINEELEYPIDVDSEWFAGTYFSTRLAEKTKSKEDIELFANHLATRDLDHEESGEMFGVFELFDALDYSKEIIPILAAWFNANSQHRGDVITIEMCDSFTKIFSNDTELNSFLALLGENISSKYTLNEVFSLILNTVLKLETEEKIENAVNKFLEVVENEHIPTKNDFI